MPSPLIAAGTIFAVAACLACGRPAIAQQPLRGYALSLATGSASSPLTARSATAFQRLRLMTEPAFGRLSIEAAYEQTLQFTAGGAGIATTLLASESAGDADWLPLQGTIAAGNRLRWADRLDRLNIGYRHGMLEARVGRQAISWATTLILTPADPFSPFDPTDPFREYRSGIDAARVRLSPGPFTELDAVVRETRYPGASTTTLLRARTTVAGWDLSAWGGSLHGQPAGALGLVRTIAGSAVRAEAELRRGPATAPSPGTDAPAEGGHAVLRAAAGIDRRLSLLGRDLTLVVEYQHDGLGAAGAGDLPRVLLSPAASRGELQVLGRDVAALQGSWQLHPLVAAQLLGLADLGDGSALLAPAVSWSASESATLRLGAFLATGTDRLGSLGVPRSEFGAIPATGYAALSFFF